MLKVFKRVVIFAYLNWAVADKLSSYFYEKKVDANDSK